MDLCLKDGVRTSKAGFACQESGLFDLDLDFKNGIWISDTGSAFQEWNPKHKQQKKVWGCNQGLEDWIRILRMEV